MPPFRNIDERFDGEALKTLRDSQPGDRVTFVDPTFEVPDKARMIRFAGSVVEAAEAVIRLVPLYKEELGQSFELNLHDRGPLTEEVDTDEATTNWQASEFVPMTQRLYYSRIGGAGLRSELGDCGPLDAKEFDELINETPVDQHVFVRTDDNFQGARVTLRVG